MSEEQAQLVQKGEKAAELQFLSRPVCCPEAVSGLERCSLWPTRRLARTCLLLERDESGEIPARRQMLTLILSYGLSDSVLPPCRSQVLHMVYVSVG